MFLAVWLPRDFFQQQMRQQTTNTLALLEASETWFSNPMINIIPISRCPEPGGACLFWVFGLSNLDRLWFAGFARKSAGWVWEGLDQWVFLLRKILIFYSFNLLVTAACGFCGGKHASHVGLTVVGLSSTRKWMDVSSLLFLGNEYLPRFSLEMTHMTSWWKFQEFSSSSWFPLSPRFSLYASDSERLLLRISGMHGPSLNSWIPMVVALWRR